MIEKTNRLNWPSASLRCTELNWLRTDRDALAVRSKAGRLVTHSGVGSHFMEQGGEATRNKHLALSPERTGGSLQLWLLRNRPMTGRHESTTCNRVCVAAERQSSE